MRRTDNPAPSTIRWRQWELRDILKRRRIDGFIEHAFIVRMRDAGVITNEQARDREKLFDAIITLASNALDTYNDTPDIG
jgi:hypothetical protein